jgi:LEA14-like dessication related protein
MLPRAPLLGLFLLSLAACSLLTPRFEKPEVTLAGVELVHGNLLQQDLRVTLSVHNPNNRAIPVSHLSADLRADGEAIASGESSHAVVVPANGDAEIEVMVTANMALVLLQVAKHHDSRSNEIAYEVSGVASFDLPFLHSLSFHQAGTFALH